MELALAAVSAFAALSVACNVLLILKNRAQRKAPALSVDAKDLLHDLTRGGAVVKIEVVNPDGLLVWKGRS